MNILQTYYYTSHKYLRQINNTLNHIVDMLVNLHIINSLEEELYTINKFDPL